MRFTLDDTPAERPVRIFLEQNNDGGIAIRASNGEITSTLLTLSAMSGKGVLAAGVSRQLDALGFALKDNELFVY